MLQIKTENLGNIDKETIIEITQNSYIFFKPEENKNIIGLFTDSLVTCSSLIISFNKDQYIFFSHIDEDSQILEVIKEISKNNLFHNIKVINIKYSKGNNSLKNDKINYDYFFKNIIDILKEGIPKKDLLINQSIQEHSNITSCLKFFNYSCFQRIINCQLRKFKINKNSIKNNEDIKDFYEEAKEIFLKNIDYNNYIIYYYNQKKLEKILANCEIKLLSIYN